MTSPQIIVGSAAGVNNDDLEEAARRVSNGNGYRDLSTVCIIPTRGKVDARVVESWWALIPPMNQPFLRMMVKGMEVADAYNTAIEMVLAHDELSRWKYILTLEEDNLPPPDGLLKLYESIDDFDCVGGLYWTKGWLGQPMIYGRPGTVPMFAPQVPEPDRVVECNGLGMGFNLFRLDMFRDERIPRPWFKTLTEYSPDQGARVMTQDLYFFSNARKAGYKVACDTRVRVGHFDSASDVVW